MAWSSQERTPRKARFAGAGESANIRNEFPSRFASPIGALEEKGTSSKNAGQRHSRTAPHLRAASSGTGLHFVRRSSRMAGRLRRPRGRIRSRHRAQPGQIFRTRGTSTPGRVGRNQQPRGDRVGSAEGKCCPLFLSEASEEAVEFAWRRLSHFRIVRLVKRRGIDD